MTPQPKSPPPNEPESFAAEWLEEVEYNEVVSGLLMELDELIQKIQETSNNAEE